MPVSGTVAELNEGLEDNPALINEDPYGEGWIIKVKLGRGGPLGLLNAEAYAAEAG